MTTRLRNPYTATSVEDGDVFAVVVTCHATPMGLRFYRCPYPNPDTAGGIPQGANYPGDNKIEDLFPTIRDWAQMRE